MSETKNKKNNKKLYFSAKKKEKTHNSFDLKEMVMIK